MSNLLELAARVEALTGPCPKVAKDIYRALFGAPELGQPGGYGWREDDAGWWLATGEDARTPPRTIYPPKWLSSLDAARSLVPGWAYPRLEFGFAEDGGWGWRCQMQNSYGVPFRDYHGIGAADGDFGMVQSLLAAALRLQNGQRAGGGE